MIKVCKSNICAKQKHVAQLSQRPCCRVG